MNCWEAKGCGREVGGSRVDELGVCPAADKEAGEACWLIAGTFCGGTVQGTFAQKEENCLACDFYKTFDMKHRALMRKKFAAEQR
ncbi:MAG: hypothetical protein KC619_33985 [Myxococcales bacterium]|nr:hypothetical protein [Myxococcales bacterium]